MCSHFEFSIIYSINFLHEKFLNDFVFNRSGYIFPIIDLSFPTDSGKGIFKNGIETPWVRNGFFKM